MITNETYHSVVESTGFIDKVQLLQRLPISRRTLQEWIRLGLIPWIKLPGTRRIIFDWPAVEAALRRNQKGGVR